MTDEERAACDLVERMLRELKTREVRLSNDWWAPGDLTRRNITLQIDDPNGLLSGRRTSHGYGLAAAIERARAARSKP